MRKDSLMIEWCRDPERARPLAALMARNLDTTYISHSELMEGRALDLDRWVAGLETRLEAQIHKALASRAEAPGGDRVGVASRGAGPVALAIIEIDPGTPPAFAVLADLVVDEPERRQGTARRLAAWIEQEMRKLGVRRLFLESGTRNERAHRLFKACGFEICSIVMSKEIGSANPS